MKTFKDLKFSITHNGGSGVRGIMNVKNYEISVIMTDGSHGGPNGLWEVAVFRKNDWKAVPMICFGVNEDTCGYLNFEDLEQKLIEIQEELGAE